MSRTTSNFPMVSVEICEPNTTNCQTVNKIQLDTGSVGLRIDSSAIKLNLPYVSTNKNRHVDECMTYGNADRLFGSVRYADVRLARDVARHTRIQIYSDKAGNQVGCTTKIRSGTSYNGILGISPESQYECPLFFGDCPEYYSCGENGDCKQVPSPVHICDGHNHCEEQIDPSFTKIVRMAALENPIYQLETDNNGFIVTFTKAIPPNNGESVGELILGVNTNKANRIRRRLRIWALSRAGLLPIQVSGISTSVLADTGTPVSDVLLDKNVNMLGLSGHVVGVQNVSASAILKATAKGMPLIFGMPFFYGKSVYFGLPSKSGQRYPSGYIAF